MSNKIHTFIKTECMNFLFSPSRSLKQKLINIIISYVVFFIWCFLVSKFLIYLNPPNPFEAPIPEGLYFGPPLKYIFFMSCIFAPLWEELVFRYAPAMIAKNSQPSFLIPIMIISSAWFGWLHGNGAESIMIQGIIGFIFFWLFLKNGYSYWSSVLLHAMWNTTVFLMTTKIW